MASSEQRKKRKSQRSELAIVEARREVLKLERETQLLAAEETAYNDLAENVRTLESAFRGRDYVDPRIWRTDSYGHEHLPFNTQDDRRDGRNPPFAETEQELAIIRGMARIVTAESCPGVGILENLTNYVMGTGFTITAGSKDDAAEDLQAAAQDVIDRFLEENYWTADLDRELFRRARRDGEYFLALYPREGRTIARVIEPDQVEDPGGEPFDEEELFNSYGVEIQHATNWTFGIHTDDHDIQTVHGYHIRWEDGGSSDYLPKEFVDHYKVNVDRNIKRGMSDFFPAWQWLTRQGKLLRNTSQGAAIQAAIAFIVRYGAGATKDSVDTLIAEKSAATLFKRTSSSGRREIETREYDEGTVLGVPKGQEYESGPTGSERGSAFIDVSQAVLRHVASRWAMPEYMISGDASNANYASTIVAESPFVKSAQAMQAQMASQFKGIIWKVIRNAVKAGDLSSVGISSGDFAKVRRLIEINIEPPQITTRDPLQETQRFQILKNEGVLSKKTWAAKEELDFEVEEDNGVSDVVGAAGGFSSFSPVQGVAPVDTSETHESWFDKAASTACKELADA